MKSFIITLATIFALTFATVARAEDDEISGHLRLLLHGAEKLDAIYKDDSGHKTHLGVAAWVTAPNLFQAPSLWQGLLGLRLDYLNAHIELLLGASIDGRSQVSRTSAVGKELFLLDTRLGLGGKPHGPAWIWANIQIVGPGSESESLYWYLEADWTPKSWLSVGAETESTLQPEDDSHALGLHFKATAGPFTAAIAYQRLLATPNEDAERNQFWVRLALNFISRP